MAGYKGDFGHDWLAVSRRMLGASERGEGVLIGHAGPAEPGPVITHVCGVVHPVIAQRIALLPGCVVARHHANRAPARPPERAGQGQSLAGIEFVITLLTVDPQAGLQRSVGKPAAAT